MAMGVVPQLDNLDVELTCRQILSVFARLYRVPRAERPAAVERALGIANLAGRAPTRSCAQLSGGMRRRLLVARGLIHRPRLVLLDEPTVGLDPQVRQELWSLIDGLRADGVTVLMSTHYIEEAERLADTVAVMSSGRIIAQGTPAELIAATPGARSSRSTVRPTSWPSSRRDGDRADGGIGAAVRRSRCSAPRGSTARPRGCAPPGEPRGRVRRPDRAGDRVSDAGTIRSRRLDPAALAGVMSRDIVLFRRYWKATTFSSIVQPTIYLLAFGLGFGSLVSHVGHVKYVEYVATGVVATAVLFSSAFPGMFNTFIRWQFQRTYDALLAAPVDVEELVTAEILWISIRAGRLRAGAADRWLLLRAAPRAGMLLVILIGIVTGFGFAAFGVLIAAVAKTIDNFNYVTSAVLTPMFLVAGTFFPISSLPARAAHDRPVQPAVSLRRPRPRRLAEHDGERRPARTPRCCSCSPWSCGAWRSGAWSPA